MKVCRTKSEYRRLKHTHPGERIVMMNIPWVPLTERPPEEDGRYLVTVSAGGVTAVEMSVFIIQDDGTPWWSSQDPIAWAPVEKDAPYWIPLTEERPPEDGAYLIIDGIDSDTEVYDTWYFRGENGEDHWDVTSPIAWAPFPSPYEGNEFYRKLREEMDKVELPVRHSSLTSTRPHVVLPEGGSRTFLGEDSCTSDALGERDDRVLIMFCCDT